MITPKFHTYNSDLPKFISYTLKKFNNFHRTKMVPLAHWVCFLFFKRDWCSGPPSHAVWCSGRSGIRAVSLLLSPQFRKVHLPSLLPITDRFPQPVLLLLWGSACLSDLALLPEEEQTVRRGTPSVLCAAYVLLCQIMCVSAQQCIMMCTRSSRVNVRTVMMDFWEWSS